MRRYSVYKDSDIEWVGEIPDRWATKPLFALFKERQVLNDGNKETNVLSLSYGRIIRRDVESNFGLLPESFETYNIVDPLNIVLRLTDLQNDKRSLRCGLVQEKGIITSAYLTLEKTKDVDCKYAYYLLHSYDLRKVFYSMGGGVRQAIKFDDLKRLPILLPSLEEQKAIASYLDRKIAQIDGLINKKERTSGFLKEERMAIVNQAVTKGINPKAEMQDSGIEWLGKIPKHWHYKRLKYLDNTIMGQSPESDNCNKDGVGIPFLQGNADFSSLNPMPSVWCENPNKLAHKGDVLLSVRAPVGAVNIADQTYGIGRGLCAIRAKRSHEKYMYYRTLCLSDELNRIATGSTYTAISVDEVNNTVVPEPELKEQEKIADYIDHKIMKIDAQIGRESKSIDSLKEYRIALIFEAVTGKIDVRES
jgi:type I restriction enzyme, S subunit